MLAVLKPVGRLKKHVMNRSMQPKHTRATVKRKPAGQSPAGFLKHFGKILSMQRDMITSMPAGIEPADFLECTH